MTVETWSGWVARRGTGGVGTRTHARFLAALAVGLGVALPGAGAAQDVEEEFPGVELGLTYEVDYQPTLAVAPFRGRLGGERAASRVQNIIARDLRYSNRFRMIDGSGGAFQDYDELDYSFWDQLGVDWVVTGRVEGAGSRRFVLVLEVHDVVFGSQEAQHRFPIPDPDDEDFRMAVHVASDAVVESILDEPGMAASRIAFSQRRDDGNQELYLIDSDGENLRRVTNHRSLSISPAWSPDGRRLAYTSYRTDYPRIYELDLQTGEERMVEVDRSGDQYTPSYHPDGDRVVFSIVGEGRSGIYTYDLREGCCLEEIVSSRWDEISPRFSPDGSSIVFNSNRLGVGTPQIYQMTASGDDQEVLSPYLYGEYGYFTSPDWSPDGERVAFHGSVEPGGNHQILVAELGGRQNRVVQLTSEGNNQDPRWAPDGRHIVYVGERSWGRGLFIVDSATGNTRTLVGGIRARVPDWSPSLAPLVEDRMGVVDR